MVGNHNEYYDIGYQLLRLERICCENELLFTMSMQGIVQVYSNNPNKKFQYSYDLSGNQLSAYYLERLVDKLHYYIARYEVSNETNV